MCCGRWPQDRQTAYREHQTPHGRQSVKKLMGHGAATNSIEVEAPKLFDRVARNGMWTMPFIKPGRTNTCCFSRQGRRMRSPPAFGILPEGAETVKIPAASPSGNSSNRRRNSLQRNSPKHRNGQRRRFVRNR